MSVCLSVCLCVCLSACVLLSVCACVCLYVCLSFCRSVSLSCFFCGKVGGEACVCSYIDLSSNDGIDVVRGACVRRGQLARDTNRLVKRNLEVPVITAHTHTHTHKFATFPFNPCLAPRHHITVEHKAFCHPSMSEVRPSHSVPQGTCASGPSRLAPKALGRPTNDAPRRNLQGG